MTHEGFPSLISLGLPHHLYGEDSPLRWWLAGSMAFHVLLALLALNLRFSPSFEQPLTSYEVSLVSSSALETPSRPKAKARPAKAKATPAKPPPPLPTEPARERLSDSFADSVKTIVVPQKRAHETMAPFQPTPMPEPLAQNELPKTLEAEPEATIIPTHTDQDTSQSTPPKPQSDVPLKTPELLQGIKAPPQTPEFTPVDPFPTARESDPTKQPSEKLTHSFKETIQSVQIPTRPTRKKTTKPPKGSKTTKPTTARPEARQLAKESPQSARKESTSPQRERLSESLKELLGSVSVPKLRDVPPTSSAPKDSTRNKTQEALESIQLPKMTKKVPEPKVEETRRLPDLQHSNKLRTEIDQQLAKLKVPDVAPIESLRKRLQIQEVTQSEGDVTQSPSSSSSLTGKASRKSRYLALVKARIDQLWVAPPVTVDKKNLQAILRFRILRSGEVTNLELERGSGHSYYDSAAQRAVQAADPLPAFPSEITETYLDVHFSFSLEESLQ